MMPVTISRRMFLTSLLFLLLLFTFVTCNNNIINNDDDDSDQLAKVVKRSQSLNMMERYYFNAARELFRTGHLQRRKPFLAGKLRQRFTESFRQGRK